jgi:PleD family two-component response regulator
MFSKLPKEFDTFCSDFVQSDSCQRFFFIDRLSFSSIYSTQALRITSTISFRYKKMKSVLIIFEKEDEARLIRKSLLSDYQVENAYRIHNALNLHRQHSFDVIFW